MQIARKRLGAMVLAACLLVALAFGGTLAIAAGLSFVETLWQLAAKKEGR